MASTLAERNLTRSQLEALPNLGLSVRVHQDADILEIHDDAIPGNPATQGPFPQGEIGGLTPGWRLFTNAAARAAYGLS